MRRGQQAAALRSVQRAIEMRERVFERREPDRRIMWGHEREGYVNNEEIEQIVF